VPGSEDDFVHTPETAPLCDITAYQTNPLSPRSGILLEKLTVTGLVKKSP
jgi:hypothetical protein